MKSNTIAGNTNDALVRQDEHMCSYPIRAKITPGLLALVNRNLQNKILIVQRTKQDEDQRAHWYIPSL